jgi:hypothetical protein
MPQYLNHMHAQRYLKRKDLEGFVLIAAAG